MGMASLIRTIQTRLCISSILATGSINSLYQENNEGDDDMSAQTAPE